VDDTFLVVLVGPLRRGGAVFMSLVAIFVTMGVRGAIDEQSTGQ
jgi:hypothetical protein